MYKNNDKKIEERINKEIDKCNMAYRLKDIYGNIFVFGGIENGCAWYRGTRGNKHIFNLDGYEVIEQYCVLH